MNDASMTDGGLTGTGPAPTLGAAQLAASLDEATDHLSPYRVFAREEWAHLRADTPLTLTADDVMRLQSLNDPISLEEVIAIYLPLSRLLSSTSRRRRGCSRRPSASSSPSAR